jgi:hypothetical protein
MAFITTAAVTWGSDDLLARPPRMAWRFLAVFVYLESASVRLLGKRPATANFELQSVPGLSLVEVHQQHQRRLRQLDGGRPRRLRAADLEAVIWCGNERLYDLLIAQGRARVNPYADVDDISLRPRVEESDVTRQVPTA